MKYISYSECATGSYVSGSALAVVVVLLSLFILLIASAIILVPLWLRKLKVKKLGFNGDDPSTVKEAAPMNKCVSDTSVAGVNAV